MFLIIQYALCGKARSVTIILLTNMKIRIILEKLIVDLIKIKKIYSRNNCDAYNHIHLN